MESVTGKAITINSIATFHHIYSLHPNSTVGAILFTKRRETRNKVVKQIAQGHTEASGRAPTQSPCHTAFL